MLKNNIMFEEHTLYTLGDIYGIFASRFAEWGGMFPLTTSKLNKILTYCNYFVGVIDYSQNPCGLSFLELVNGSYQGTEISLTFLNKLYQRYREHYCFDMLTNTSSIEEYEMQNSGKFFRKVINLLDYTYPKYQELITLYTNQKSHLMDRLSRIRSGERNTQQDGETSNDGSYKDLHNDTPQTSDVVATLEQNQFVSDLSKGENHQEGTSSQTGNDTFEETETHDPTTIMERLSEVEKKFAQIYRKWLDEFEELFIEEVNF